MEGLRRRRVVENLQKLKKIIDLPSTKEEMIKELYGIKQKQERKAIKTESPGFSPRRNVNNKVLMNTLKPSDSEIRKVILLESTESDESQSSSGDEWSPNSHSSPFPRKSRHGSCRKFRGEVELLHKTAKHNPGMLMEAALSETGRRYPFREKRPVSYALNTAIPMDDRFLYCYKCQYSYLGGCVKHPVVWVENGKLKVCEEVKHKFVYFQTLKCVCGLQYYLHSAHTAPKEWVIIARSGIPGAGFGAWSNKLIEQGTTFGPYSGDIVHLEAMDGTEYTRRSRGGYAWLVRSNVDGVKAHLVDARNPLCSNWLRFVNCARCEEEQNLVTVQYRGKIYYRACQDILRNSELLTYYGSEFASEMESTQIDQIQVVPEEKTDPCEICGKTFTREDNLRRHVSSVHMKEKTDPCEICGKTFTEEGNLRKHVSSVHMKDKTDPCEICGKTFTEEGNLRKHVSSVHMSAYRDWLGK